jgi:hypothetical protein
MTVSTVFCQTNFIVNCGNRNRRDNKIIELKLTLFYNQIQLQTFHPSVLATNFSSIVLFSVGDKRCIYVLSKRRWCGNIGRNVHLWTLRWWCSEIFTKRCTLYMHMMSMEFEKIHPWLENSNSNKTANVSMRKVNPNSDSPPCNGYGELGNYVTRYCHHIQWW